MIVFRQSENRSSDRTLNMILINFSCEDQIRDQNNILSRNEICRNKLKKLRQNLKPRYR